MAHRFAQLVFTDTVRNAQSEYGSREMYKSMDRGEDYNFLLSENEAMFISQRDSFYMASVSETGWPYVQHRGGPVGFVKVLDAETIGFSDFSGNRQYVSTGNFRTNDRVALFFMDYPNRRRLKLLGKIHVVSESDWDTLAALELDDYQANIERAFVIKIEAFDWNCPQHITPRFTELEIQQAIAPVIEENERLKATIKEKGSLEIKSEMGNGELPLVISGIRQLTPRIRAYELKHRDGFPLPKITAGAHIKVPLMLDNQLSWRHYSICSNSARHDVYEIAVLKENHGNGGSQAIHESYSLGDVLHCDFPENYFHLHDDDRPAVLLAAGIGITPIKSMAQALRLRGTHFELHYAGKNLNEMAFQEKLIREFSNEMSLYQSEEKQRLNFESILKESENNTVFYGCGPDSFIDDFRETARKLKISSDRIRFERFNAASLANAKPISVTLLQTKKLIQVAENQSILDAMLDEGINIPYSCKNGECKTCATKVIEGDPIHMDNCLSDKEREEGWMCPCVSRSTSEQLVLDV